MRHCNSSFPLYLCDSVLPHLCPKVTLFALTALQPHMHWGYSRPKPTGWVFTLQPSLSTAWGWGKGAGHLTHQPMSVFLNTAQYCSIQPTITQYRPLFLNTAHYFSIQPTISQYSPLLKDMITSLTLARKVTDIQTFR